MGSDNRASQSLELRVQYRPLSGPTAGTEARCGDFDLTQHLDAWDGLPPLAGDD